jgi:hypothetical protein
MKPAHAIMLLPLLLSAASCGGRVPDDSGGGGAAAVQPGETMDVGLSSGWLARVRERCAAPWKLPDVGGSTLPSPERITGRWLRCPEDAPGQQPPALVATFEAFELIPEHQYIRLALEGGTFEPQMTGLGDLGTWQIIGDELLFSLPPCSEGYVSIGTATKCGGLDSVLPLFEAPPSSRMRFYGAGSFYVRVE